MKQKLSERILPQLLKVEVGKTYIDRSNHVVRITSLSPTGWFKSNESSYRKDGISFHGSQYDLYKLAD